MTRREIINLAVKKAEAGSSTGIIETSRTLLNLAIQRLAHEFTWDFLRKSPTTEISLIAGQRRYDLPADLVGVDSFVVLNGNYRIRLVQKNNDFFSRITDLTADGFPDYYLTDPSKSPTVVSGSSDTTLYPKIEFDKVPDKAYSTEMKYFYEPESLDVEDWRVYDASTTLFPDYVMVEALTYELFEYLDDDRANNQWAKVEQKSNRYLNSNAKFNSASGNIPLDGDFFE